MPLELQKAITELVAIDTSGPRGGSSALPYFMDLLYHGDFSIMEQAAYTGDGNHTNLIGVKGPPGDGGLLLVAPTRGMPAGDPDLWTETLGNPLAARVHQGRVYGLNTLSGKLDLLCKLLAAMRTPKAALKRPVYLAGTFGEEAAPMGGGAYMLESGLVRPSMVLVGYPTNLELIREHRGHLVFRIDLRRGKNIWRLPSTRGSYRFDLFGRPAHGSTPHLGSNAVAEGLRYLTMLAAEGLATVHNVAGGESPNRVPDTVTAILLATGQAIPQPPPSGSVTPIDDDVEVSFPVNDCLQIWRSLRPKVEDLLSHPPRFDAPEGAAWPRGLWNLGRVTSQPSGLSLTYELRATMDHDTEALLANIEELCEAAGDATKQHSVELTVIKDQPPLSAANDTGEHPLVERCREALREVGVTPTDGESDGHTEAWLFSAYGLETVVFGPGFSSGVLCRPNEYVSMDHLVKAVQFYERVIQKVCCK